MLPYLSSPLIKDIRTGEGILEWVLAAAGAVAGATGNLSISHTALYLTIVAGIKGIRRGLVKIVALQQAIGYGGPVPLATLGQAGPTAEAILQEIATAEVALENFQKTPGTPASKVAAGLSPSVASPPVQP